MILDTLLLCFAFIIQVSYIHHVHPSLYTSPPTPYLTAKCGAFKNSPISTPANVPATGIVMIHANSNSPTLCQLTALSVPLQRPTPTVAPVMHMDVETGSAYCEKRRTVMAAPSSMEEPREGEW